MKKKQGQFRFASRLVVGRRQRPGSTFWKTLDWSANWHNAFRRFARNNYRRRLRQRRGACLSIYSFFSGFFFRSFLHAVVIFPMIFFASFHSSATACIVLRAFSFTANAVFPSFLHTYLYTPPFYLIRSSHGNSRSQTSTPPQMISQSMRLITNK